MPAFLRTLGWLVLVLLLAVALTRWWLKPTEHWRERFNLKGHTDRIAGIALSRDGGLLASASDDGTVRLWNVVTGQAVQTLNVPLVRAQAVAFSPDGQLLAMGRVNGDLSLWSFVANREVAAAGCGRSAER